MASDESALYAAPAAKATYEAISKLQSAAAALGETLPIPEIVCVGGQSDGKSSLLEALLGFRFNVRETEMGTRRPLMVQMSHDPTAEAPRIRLQDEGGDGFGDPIQPESAVVDAIRERTEALLRSTGKAVSDKPIVMRAEYKYSPNFSLIDMPGLIMAAREHEPASTPDDILAMVRAAIAPTNRLVLFLQQSSVEWASSTWLRVIREADPHFSRTLVVVSKFDNRLKELQARREADKYLGASGYLPSGVRPFFVALPTDRAAGYGSGARAAADFRGAVAATDGGVLTHLREGVEGGFDEGAFGDRVGFAALRAHLLGELQRRYADAVPVMLSVLEERTARARAELEAADAALREVSDVAAVRRRATEWAMRCLAQVPALLDGAADPDPAAWGQSTQEERAAYGGSGWPGVPAGAVTLPASAPYKLHGGSAFNRAVEELCLAADALPMPASSCERVMNVLLSLQAGAASREALVSVAVDVSRNALQQALGPLLDAACDRLAHVLRRVHDLSVERARAAGSCAPHASFGSALRRAHDRFVTEHAAACKQLLRHHLQTATSRYAAMSIAAPALREPARPAAASEAEETGLQHHLEPEVPAVPLAIRLEEECENLPPGYGVCQDPADREIPETPEAEMGAGARPKARRRALTTLASASGHSAPPPQSPQPKRQRRASEALPPPVPQSEGYGDGGPGGGAYDQVVAMARDMFAATRHSLLAAAVPTALRAGLLAPMREELPGAVAAELFARTDDDFLRTFSAAGLVDRLRGDHEACEARHTTLLGMKAEFERTAAAIA